MDGEVVDVESREEVLARRAVVRLLKVSDQVRRSLSGAIEPSGVTGQQYNVLRILRGAHPEPLATLEIADRVLEQTPGITRLLDRLKAKGLVVRWRHERDRRQVLCAITEAGLALLSTLDEPVAKANVSAVGALSSGELEELVELLDKLAH